jgi:hypothetical protein
MFGVRLTGEDARSSKPDLNTKRFGNINASDERSELFTGGAPMDNEQPVLIRPTRDSDVEAMLAIYRRHKLRGLVQRRCSRFSSTFLFYLRHRCCNAVKRSR